MVTTSPEDKSSSQLTDSYTLGTVELSQHVEIYVQAAGSAWAAAIPQSLSVKQRRGKKRYTVFSKQSRRLRSQPLIESEELMNGLQALRLAADQQTYQTSYNYWSQSQSTQSRHTEISGYHADPIQPLRQRDVSALSELFLRDDMSEIEVDVNHRLLSLMPEPCWDEDPFEFLREFL